MTPLAFIFTIGAIEAGSRHLGAIEAGSRHLGAIEAGRGGRPGINLNA